ncbi:hypothetical protein [Geotalea sp. SG265]|uniref:hypothetical protein n=1 Tax=Geotalea sp. SG265 TaxID=2922867 RepID=UPI001FAF5FAF|nr:hypothetical protein [Geotalea sp. SG265]
MSVANLKEITVLQMKKFVVMVLIGITLFLGYKLFHSLYDINMKTLDTNRNIDVSEKLVGLDQRIDKAKIGVKMDCGDFSLSKADGEFDTKEKEAVSVSCTEAKKELAEAKKAKEVAMAGIDKRLTQEEQNRMFFTNAAKSIHGKPFPWALFVAFGVALSITATVLIMQFMPKKNARRIQQ